MADRVLPKWAHEKLLGQTIKGVSETAPHSVTLYFSDGDALTLTAMPFNSGVLDAQFVEDCQ
ncbi:MAG: hypothetical protein AAFX45_10650 [Pseudomonadota bacterium]